MIDLHTHILYGLDDGPETAEETMAMLCIAAEEGIHTIVATPHFIHGANSYSAKNYDGRLAEIQEQIQARAIPITLLTGNEMLLDEWSAKNYKAKSVRTIANSRYALVEFPMVEIPHYTENLLDGLLEEGLTPLIAHPERYPDIQEDPGRIERLIHRGCLTQVNSGSITGIYGKAAAHTAKILVQHHMVHVVASDCHSTGRRAPRLKEARLQVEAWASAEMGVQLFETNPVLIIENQTIEIMEPLEIKRQKGVLHTMKNLFHQRFINRTMSDERAGG